MWKLGNPGCECCEPPECIITSGPVVDPPWVQTGAKYKWAGTLPNNNLQLQVNFAGTIPWSLKLSIGTRWVILSLDSSGRTVTLSEGRVNTGPNTGNNSNAFISIKLDEDGLCLTGGFEDQLISQFLATDEANTDLTIEILSGTIVLNTAEAILTRSEGTYYGPYNPTCPTVGCNPPCVPRWEGQRTLGMSVVVTGFPAEASATLIRPASQGFNYTKNVLTFTGLDALNGTYIFMLKDNPDDLDNSGCWVDSSILVDVTRSEEYTEIHGGGTFYDSGSCVIKTYITPGVNPTTNPGPPVPLRLIKPEWEGMTYVPCNGILGLPFEAYPSRSSAPVENYCIGDIDPNCLIETYADENSEKCAIAIALRGVSIVCTFIT